MRSLARRVVSLIAFSPLCIQANAADKLPITLTISVPQNVTAGADIKVIAVLKNESDHTIQIARGDPYTGIIHQENGYEARRKPGVWGWGGSMGRIGLEPGTTFTEYVSLNEYDLMPGTYVVQATRPLDADGYPKSTILTSNEVTITVTPSKQEIPVGVQIKLSTSTPEVPFGAVARFKIELTNRANHEISCKQIWIGTVNLSDRLDLLDANGRWIQPRESGGPADIKSCALAPGESKEWEQDLVPSDYPKLEPGKYTAQVSTMDPDSPHSGVSHSNAVRLTMQVAPQHSPK